MSDKFYVYFLRRPDKEDQFEPGNGQPFYVGKGKEGRYLEHRKEAQQAQHKPGKKIAEISIIHKLWKADLDFTEDIIFDNLTEDEAFEYEVEAIAAYGRVDLGTGCLANLTNGGEGSVGYLFSADALQRIREAKLGSNNPMYGKSPSKSHRQKLREASLNMSQETKQKMSDSRMGEKNHFYGKHHTELSCLKMKESHCGEKHNWYGKTLTDEHKQRIGDSNRNKVRTPETIQKLKDSHWSKKMIVPQEWKDKISAGLYKYYKNKRKKEARMKNEKV